VRASWPSSCAMYNDAKCLYLSRTISRRRSPFMPAPNDTVVKKIQKCFELIKFSAAMASAKCIKSILVTVYANGQSRYRTLGDWYFNMRLHALISFVKRPPDGDQLTCPHYQFISIKYANRFPFSGHDARGVYGHFQKTSKATHYHIKKKGIFNVFDLMLNYPIRTTVLS
jgi:hypothetical protein